MSGLAAATAEAVRGHMLARFGLMPQTFSDAELEQRLRSEFGSEAEIVECLRRAVAEPLEGPDLQRLVAALTIRESSFLRQLSWFEALARDFIDPIIRRKRMAGERRLCLWSAGCSSGEEAYSLALMARELLPDIQAWQVEVHGTDICTAALEQARHGGYRLWSLRELSAERRAAHFAFRDGEAQVSQRLRAMVHFRLGNLFDGTEAGPEAPDIVLCRNVLMHLTPAARAEVARRLVRRLGPGGILVTAPSEASPDLFRPLVRQDHGELLVFEAPAAVMAPPARFERPARRTARMPPRPGPSGRPPATAPGRAPPDAAGLDAVGLDAVGPDAVGPDAVGPDAVGLDAVGPDAVGPDADPPDLETAVDRLVAAKRFAEARRACERRIEADPLDPAPLRLLAAVQEASRDLPEACRTLLRLLYLDEEDCDARFRLAGLLRRLGRPANARRELRSIVDIASRPGRQARETAEPDPVRARILRAARQMLDAWGADGRAAGDRA